MVLTFQWLYRMDLVRDHIRVLNKGCRRCAFGKVYESCNDAFYEDLFEYAVENHAHVYTCDFERAIYKFKEEGRIHEIITSVPGYLKFLCFFGYQYEFLSIPIHDETPWLVWRFSHPSEGTIRIGTWYV